jgi:hypothetical protein
LDEADVVLGELSTGPLSQAIGELTAAELVLQLTIARVI